MAGLDGLGIVGLANCLRSDRPADESSQSSDRQQIGQHDKDLVRNGKTIRLRPQLESVGGTEEDACRGDVDGVPFTDHKRSQHRETSPGRHVGGEEA